MREKNHASYEQQASYAAHKIWGEEGNGSEGGLDPVIYQGNEGICAIRSQQIILRDYGIDVSIDELKEYAIQNGWYDPEGGTPQGAVGLLLEACGVHCEQSDNNTVYDLVNELAQGHRVIVAVDANELWADRNGNIIDGAKEWFKDAFGNEEANHALVVAGVEVNPDDPDDIKVILTDPGTGDLRIEYDMDDFMDAWEDSKCFMVSTDSPAPLQYNPETGREEPSNFAINEYIDANSLPLDANNIILPEEMAANSVNAYYQEGHIDNVPVEEGKEIEYNKYSEAIERAKSVAIGGGHFGEDHFDFDSFKETLSDIFDDIFGGDDDDEGPGIDEDSVIDDGGELDTNSTIDTDTDSISGVDSDIDDIVGDIDDNGSISHVY